MTITSSVLNEGDTTGSAIIQLSYFFSTVIGGEQAAFATSNCNIIGLTTNATTADNTIMLITVQVTDFQFQDTTIGVSLAANTFFEVDNSGNYNDVPYSFSWIYSRSLTLPPTLEITSSVLNEGDTTSISTIDLSFVFSSTVNVDPNSFATSNCLIRGLNVDPNDGTITILTVEVSDPQFQDTTIGVSMAASTFYEVNNISIYNDVSYSFSWIYSASAIEPEPSTSAATPPTVTITSSVLNEGDTTSISIIQLSFVFSSTVNFSPSSFATSNCFIRGFNVDPNDGTIKILTVEVSDPQFQDTTIGVSIGANSFYEVTNSGNFYNDVSYSFSWIYSASVPEPEQEAPFNNYSNNPTNPSIIQIDTNQIILYNSVSNYGLDRVDYVTFNVPLGKQIKTLELVEFIRVEDNAVLFRIQKNTTVFDDDATDYWNCIMSPSSLNTNLLKDPSTNAIYPLTGGVVSDIPYAAGFFHIQMA